MQYVKDPPTGLTLQPPRTLRLARNSPSEGCANVGVHRDDGHDELVNVQDVFMLLSPTEVSSLLLNEVPDMASKLARDMVPYEWAVSLAERAVPSLPAPMLAEVGDVVSSYLSGFVVMLQQQVDKVIDLKELVVTAMCTDRVVLVDLFRKCGATSLILVNSGLFFGFLLGVIQWSFGHFTTYLVDHDRRRRRGSSDELARFEVHL